MAAPMEVIEASFNGTLRTILWLVLAWMALRWFLQYQRNAAARRNAHANAHQNTPPRAKGEVRIENVPPVHCWARNMALVKVTPSAASSTLLVLG